MHIFALETNIKKLEQSFASQGEQLLMTIHYSRFVFFFAVLVRTFILLILVGIGVLLWMNTAWPLWWIFAGLGFVSFFTVFWPLLRTYIHWHFSFIQMTTAKIVVVDQSSLFHQEITQISLENFASVSAETQFWNIFPFGKLHFNLKEGTAEEFKLKYIPHAQLVAEKVADVVTAFQRRKNVEVL